MIDRETNAAELAEIRELVGTMIDRETNAQLEEIIEQVGQLRAELAALRQDVQTILQHIPIQMIPDRDAEVQ